MVDETSEAMPPQPTPEVIDEAAKHYNYQFVLIDHTTLATPSEMRPAGYFTKMAAAWAEQINKHFAPAWGVVSYVIRIGGISDRGADEIAINFRDTIPEAPDALAYHQVVNGIPDIELGVDLFSSIAGDFEPLTGGCSHEILELLGDPGANLWADKQDGSGKTCARETCDLVQNTLYKTSNGMSVSNFVLPHCFIPGAKGPLDYLKAMSSRDDLSHGYEIQASEPQSIAQVMGDEMRNRGCHLFKHRTLYAAGTLPEGNARKRKSHPFSRTYRRGVRL